MSRKRLTPYARALKQVRATLKKDPEMFYGWQANIAMAIYDEMERSRKAKGRSLNRKELHSAANAGAITFLQRLIK